MLSQEKNTLPQWVGCVLPNEKTDALQVFKKNTNYQGNKQTQE